ncbi:MAG: hypothetical protein ACYCZR_06880 [Burkholderiales bacterium]
MKRPEFSPDQLKALTKWRVTPEQISRLSGVLLECKRMIDEESKAAKPSRSDVRDVLDSALDKNREARKAMEKLLRGGSPASLEALERVERESFKLGGDGTEIEAALHALSSANAMLVRALRELPAEPVRRQTAIWGPVLLIHQALGDDDSFKPSSGTDSPFRKLVGICYSAIHGEEGEDRDPERPVKDYCRWLGTQHPEQT